MQQSSAPEIDYGGLAALRGILAPNGHRRVFVISGPGLRHVERIRVELQGSLLEVFPGARRHVPAELVEEASRRLESFGPDSVVSVGGGSATGLAKALRLEHEFFFVAVPTTYAGSELTDLYGITSAAGKRTGRDRRVIPDFVVYDLELTRDMPLGLSVTSLMNALAHPLSALSSGKLDNEQSERALQAAAVVYSAIGGLLREPTGTAARREALEGTVLAGGVLRSSPLGLHHQIAHSLGGSFDLDHAGLHSVLLPHSVHWLSRQAPEVHSTLQTRLGDAALAHTLLGFLERAGVATSLAQLALSEADLARFLRDNPALPAVLLEAAFRGRAP
jgi:maleylacetate reductase